MPNFFCRLTINKYTSIATIAGTTIPSTSNALIASIALLFLCSACTEPVLNSLFVHMMRDVDRLVCRRTELSMNLRIIYWLAEKSVAELSLRVCPIELCCAVMLCCSVCLAAERLSLIQSQIFGIQ